MSNSDYVHRDLASIWHPCSQMKDHEWLPMLPIRRAKGVWLEDFEGKRYLDAISSWWVNLFGHCNPHINAALKAQLDELEHSLFAGLTHEPAILLSEQLIELAPPGLSKCFYADNGSAAIEVALKMSFHYWLNRGDKQKTRFITLGNSYHGETLGALSVGNVQLYRDTYGPLLLDTIRVPSPDCFHRANGESCFDYSTRAFEHMKQALERHAHEACAVIVEPLVQCAGSMRMYDPVYLKLLRKACDEYGVHLIADEIAVGFGRTGTMFACEQADITPDFLCLSKGITGGYLPLSVVLTSDDMYRAFYDDYQKMKAFLHSHSYTGNALACRAALATLELFKANDTIANNRKLARCMALSSEHFREHPNVGEIRQTGMILAIELVKKRSGLEPFPWQERRGLRVYQHGLKNEVLLRPLGNVVYFMPPYVISEAEIDLMVSAAWRGIQEATRN
ncbi:MAG: adenosylmethionine--8-amino-7-oxononanoate transaminase [Thiogranum sp.]|nr:adenosylmethionine--8-amino-7-oxononanoate transaminase [Thiogranum sp.]